MNNQGKKMLRSALAIIIKTAKGLGLSDGVIKRLIEPEAVHEYNFSVEFTGPAASFLPVNARSAPTPPSLRATVKRGWDVRRPVAGTPSSRITRQLLEIEKLLTLPKVVAVGEVGLDRHIYQKTKYRNYQIDEKFIGLQKQLFIEQIKLAIKYEKSLIIHSREAAGEMLAILGESSLTTPLTGHIVFHCCEANDRLVEFALNHHIYIGVDGDVTYSKSKQEFVKKVPLELLVLETDSPFLLPEPLRSQKIYPNEPKNLLLIAEKIAELKKTSIKHLIEATTENAKKLFQTT